MKKPRDLFIAETISRQVIECSEARLRSVLIITAWDVRRQYIGRGERKVDPSLLAAEAGGTVVVGGGWREWEYRFLDWF